MSRTSSVATIVSMLILCLLILPAQAEASCTKAELQAAVDRYITAQKTGNLEALQLSENVKYSENLKTLPVESGILSEALPIAFHRDFQDMQECAETGEIFACQKRSNPGGSNTGSAPGYRRNGSGYKGTDAPQYGCNNRASVGGYSFL